MIYMIAFTPEEQQKTFRLIKVNCCYCYYYYNYS